MEIAINIVAPKAPKNEIKSEAIHHTFHSPRKFSCECPPYYLVLTDSLNKSLTSMKSRFFKKSLPQSASCDSQLSATQQPQLSATCATSNSIDKPSSNNSSRTRPTSLMMGGCPTAGDVAGTPTSSTTTTNGSKQYFMLSPVTAATSATSPSCSSTQGIIAGVGGCGNINELLEQYRGWHSMAPLPCTNAMVRHGASIPATPSCSGNQVADLVFTLAQQISHKDAHIERIRAAMRKGDVRAERACRELEREVERKTQELARVRKRLRVYETELQVAQRVNEQLQQNVTNSNNLTNNQSTLENKLEQLIAENADLRAKLTRLAQLDIEHDMEADQNRQAVRSLRAKLEQVQQDLQRREAHAADMQAELERAVVEREMARMELAASDHHNGKKDHQHHHGITMPMSSLESSLVEDGNGEGGPSLASSSGISTNLFSSDTIACRKLGECHAKVCHLVRMAEKAQSGQRLGREDLFGCGGSDTASTSGHFDEHVQKLRCEVELLHDKFIILYARGAIGRWE